jgi:hypothetical protein
LEPAPGETRLWSLNRITGLFAITSDVELLRAAVCADLPPILRSNPHPEYIELWTINKNAFWKKYWMDKKNGTMKYASRRFTVAGGKKG